MTRVSGEDRQKESAAGRDTLAAILGVLAAGLLVAAPSLVDTSGPDPFYKGPLIFPMLTLGLIAAAAVPAVVRIVRRRGRALFALDGAGLPVRGAVLFLLACAFPVAVGAVGIFLATAGFCAMGLTVTRRSWREVMAVSVLLPLAVYAVFVLILDVWFPSPWLLDLGL
ncbi:MAG: tripartite tricarboxylate transporter TctB family protein [Pseudomonadota bacterium]